MGGEAAECEVAIGWVQPGSGDAVGVERSLLALDGGEELGRGRGNQVRPLRYSA